MKLSEAEAYFAGHVVALKQMCLDGTPWIFLCASVVIEYMSKLAAGNDPKGPGFKQFIRDYFPADYGNFKYKSGDIDLPDQMYHVLRCGIVHSFSLIPDTHAKSKGGRNRSVVLSHDEPHLSSYSSTNAPDACCLRADGFIADLEVAMKKLFTDAAANSQLALNITTWLSQHPPITGNI